MRYVIFPCFFIIAALATAAFAETKKIAVLVGVDDYAQIGNLQYTKNDVRAIRDRLYEIGFEKTTSSA